ncbi:uncharacterized protein LOC120109088 [Phoenix dactylifera]|uniref:Glycosyltransferase n=1 Tax=Phoenix dactylifera TaxID=42345 RepID=A0A8B8ZWS8_PHODC|nr:uncharacterized protein LOC120109088 [Phoenix dactylifera]
MHPKRGSLLSLLFILSFAVIFLYSYHYHSSLHFSHSQNPNPNPNPNPQRFAITIKLLTFDRIDSLRRCLRSLSAADYGGDRVNLHVFVDHFRAIDPANGSALLDRKLEESRRILDLVDGFSWPHGEKLVHYRTANVGLQAQWLEAWWPKSDDDFAFVVEDDLELSPLYYKFLKELILKYYYDRSNYSPLIYGASLQRPRFVAGKHGNKLWLDSETHLFLYQMVGTWGQLLFPRPWKEFRLWYDVHKAKGIKPILQGMVTTGWYKKMGDRIWTPWFIKYIHSRGYYNIYTHFLHERALSISYRDAGVNYGKTAGPDSKLLDKNSIDFDLWELQPLKNLKWYDFCFREVHLGRIVRRYEELESVLHSFKEQKTIILVSLYRTVQRIARNLICHLERVGLQNFILISDDSEFLIDLAQRGYSVIDAKLLISSIGSDKSNGFEHFDMNLMKEIWVKANVVKKILELGYNLWVLDWNIIPISNPLLELPDPSYDFFAAKDVGLMYMKSSPSSLKVWVADFISNVAAVGKSLLGSNSISLEQKNFLYFATKALEDKGDVRLWQLDESSIGVRLGDDALNLSALDSRKMLFWSPGMSLTSVQRELENLDMWLIDGDSSCVAVFCHQ